MTDSFATWLHGQTDDPDELGNLARSAQADSGFPKHGDKAIYEGYYETADTDPAFRDAFERAWNEFEGLPPGR